MPLTTKITTWIKGHKIIIASGLILLTVITITTVVILGRERPTPPTQITPISKFNQFQGLVYSFTSVRYEGEVFTPPPQLGIYQNTAVADPQEVPKKIAAYLNYSKSENLKNTWVSADQSHVLLLDEAFGYVTIFTTTPGSSREPLGNNFDLDFTLSRASSYLNAFGLNNLTPIKEGMVYLTNDTEPKETIKANAYLIKTPFSYFIESYPVYFQNQTLQETYFLLDKNAEIIKFITYPFQLQPSLIKQSTTLSVEQALENIKKNNFTVVNSSNIFEGKTGSLRIQDLVFKSVSLEYRFLREDNTITPFYHFIGDGLAANNQATTTIEVVTPAVLE